MSMARGGTVVLLMLCGMPWPAEAQRPAQPERPAGAEPATPLRWLRLPVMELDGPRVTRSQ